MSGPRRRQSSTAAQIALTALLVVCSAWGSARAAPFELPALEQPASQERHPGKMIWVDLVTPDLAAAQRFYGALFAERSAHFKPGSASRSSSTRLRFGPQR